MSDSPLVSIVVNNYNHARYLPECLDALISQTYNNIEIIVVDAYSTDDSRSIIKQYADKDIRIKPIFCQRYEPYPAITYNLGFLHTTGDLIAIADPDDISLSHRIACQVDFLMSNPEVGVCGTNCREFNDKQDILVETTVKQNVHNAAPPARNPTLMLRKDCLARYGMWNWKCEYAADFEWLYRFYSNGVKFHILEQCCLMYRYAHGTNISVNKQFNQSLKLALFRTYFGIKNLNVAGFNWWRITVRTYLSCIKRLLVMLPRAFIFKLKRA